MLFADLRFILVTSWTHLFDIPYDELNNPQFSVLVAVWEGFYPGLIVKTGRKAMAKEIPHGGGKRFWWVSWIVIGGTQPGSLAG
jgi:hypothetical protein